MIEATPQDVPFPVAQFLNLSPDELAKSLLKCDKNTSSTCSVPVRVGIFFDGTNNNLARDRDGERVPVAGVPGEGTDVTGGDSRLPSLLCGHSNVARLFQAYAVTKFKKGIFSYYIPGVGTRFKEIGELTETSEGKAFAKGGQARIIFAILKVINSVHMALKETPLYNDIEAGRIAQSYDSEIAAISRQENGGTQNPHVEFFAKYVDALREIIRYTPKPTVPSLQIDVFGFSRGAAEAVAFCHMFDDLL